MFDEGLGVKQDKLEALTWYSEAASRGNAEAKYYCGLAYDIGDPIPQDYKNAITFYKESATLGNDTAQFNLGVIHAEGKGVVQDYVQAHKWFNIAGANGNDDGRESRDILEEKMTPAQISQSQQLAREWMEEHMEIE
jgi:hypothetical protein